MIGSRDVIVKRVELDRYFILKRSWCTLGNWVMVGPLHTNAVKAEEEAKLFAKEHHYHYRGLKLWWEI